MVAKCNNYSNETIKTKKVQWQYDATITVTAVNYSLSHLKLTQQRFCMNFVRRRSSATLVIVRNCSWRYF